MEIMEGDDVSTRSSVKTLIAILLGILGAVLFVIL
jgi:hypothetical protein